MRATRLLWSIAVGTVVLAPWIAHAQEAALSGTVTDATGGVLPGVTVVAVHEASGNTFQAVTDERGGYRIAVRIGVYQITAELSGFTTITRSGIALLVGQTGVVNLQMSPAGVQESVTVTAAAPLLDTTQSSLGGNIDSLQMQELPVNGRNWQDLVILAAGNRANAVTDAPTSGDRAGNRDYQLNIDGQEVSQNMIGSTRGQPRFSRDAIAEFQFLSSRFDATQGRSSGVQVNAVTKSGTNTPSGTVSGYFRDDELKAADFITGRVLPYSNQQVSTTFGGPFIRDRFHFFSNYEYEREPRAQAFSTAYPRFNIEVEGIRRLHMGGLRLDYQLSSQTRLMARMSKFREWIPYQGANSAQHPASMEEFKRNSDNVLLSLTNVIGNRALNEVKAGFAGFYYATLNYTAWPQHPQAAAGITYGSPRITFTGFGILGNDSSPQKSSTNAYSIRDDFTLSFAKGGRHAVKAGGEYIYQVQGSSNCRSCMGLIDAQGGPIPANIEALFPIWDDASTWNIAALNSITRRYEIGVGKFKLAFDEHNIAGWVQDDWTVTSRLTLNLGVRYDLGLGIWGNELAVPPLLEAGRPNDTNNIAPRLGFAYSFNDRTVMRGGYGRYYGELVQNLVSHTIGQSNIAILELLPDGRPDFVVNPFNGPFPTYEQATQRFCSVRNVPGCLRRSTGGDNIAPPPEYAHLPFSHQASIGLQRQVGTSVAVEADYVFVGGRGERATQGNINLSYNPETGLNYPFSDISRRPFPDWGTIGMNVMGGRSNYHALQTAFTKRMSNRWQASATYTLGALRDFDRMPLSGLKRVTFPVAPDLGGEYTPAAGDQRHRAVFNGIWQAGYGFQLSGLYFFGSGERFSTSFGGDRRQCGAGCNRLRSNGTVVPRNSFVGEPIHRVDMRLQRRFGLGGRAAIDGMIEVFNLFNHENHGSYTTAESNARYGRPTANPNVAYQPRMAQLGFRLAF
ncbi:MAG: TonB-dependent receptor [Acidobacteria bacterium]|nr:TonB-dependent receptor [Acidobacteriota bacterium]